jgi:hypothetical protein
MVSRAVYFRFHPAAAALLLGGLATLTPVDEAAGLGGSRSSLARQNLEARRHDFTYLRTRSQVEGFVAKGYLVPVSTGGSYILKSVSFPYARPAVKLFIERLSTQYQEACGEKLVVTSLTRPKSHQPANASPRSVHPTGMALDLRRSWRRSCRAWLEGVLLSLEDEGVLEATYERWPPHYHIAIFPQKYQRYVEWLQSRSDVAPYRVAHGDTLWKIAAKHQTTVHRVKEQNGLRSSRIYPGQLLEIPLEN